MTNINMVVKEIWKFECGVSLCSPRDKAVVQEAKSSTYIS